MIAVEQKKNTITILGHAGYAPMGQDIVCAAVSTLAQTLIASLEDLTRASDGQAVIEPGNIFIRYKNGYGDAELLVRSFILGCRMVAATYPDYVKVESEDY